MLKSFCKWLTGPDDDENEYSVMNPPPWLRNEASIGSTSVNAVICIKKEEDEKRRKEYYGEANCENSPWVVVK
jgi:hypothetical protein